MWTRSLDAVQIGSRSGSDSRKKAFSTAVYTLEFISKQFGKDTSKDIRYYDNLTGMLVNMKKSQKLEDKRLDSFGGDREERKSGKS